MYTNSVCSFHIFVTQNQSILMHVLIIVLHVHGGGKLLLNLYHFVPLPQPQNASGNIVQYLYIKVLVFFLAKKGNILRKV